ncbi:flagellar protein FliT [Cupriavidus sp. 2TAF22]|uniref:flagellar protein FliT n=1 Tax=unclassified Cupriavidus TaxID=2640874 RepID=UPI003F90ABC8
MHRPSPVLSCYEELELLAEQMLETARANHWDALSDLQKVYMAQVDRLRQLKDEASFPEHERSSRFHRLERILAYDAAIRDLLMPELTRFGGMIASARRQQSLGHAYGVAG